ncbi:MAG: hypothetical protein LC749_18215, partial [Actinobacteria bacterium]|nr:hypothetical protein [Actinomycetota bacterium]
VWRPAYVGSISKFSRLDQRATRSLFYSYKITGVPRSRGVTLGNAQDPLGRTSHNTLRLIHCLRESARRPDLAEDRSCSANLAQAARPTQGCRM